MAKPIIVSISDHALIRWLERVQGIDMEFFRAEIAGIVSEPTRMGATCFRRDGFEYIIQNGVLVTVQRKKRPVPVRAHREAADG